MEMENLMIWLAGNPQAEKRNRAKDTKGREMKSELDIVHFAAVSVMHENSQLKTDSKLVLKPKLAVPELNEWNEDLKTEEGRKLKIRMNGERDTSWLISLEKKCWEY